MKVIDKLTVILATLLFITSITGLIIGGKITNERYREQVAKHEAEVIEVTPLEPDELSEYDSACEEVMNACVEYGLPIYKTLAICILETGRFTSKAYLEGNNYCGISVAEEPVYYESKEDGIKAMVRCMKMYENMTVVEMSKKYCPVNYLSWSIAVEEIVQELMNS